MLVAVVLATVSIAGHAAAAAAVPEKIYYDLEDAEKLFQDFIGEYKKDYKSDNEYFTRLTIFKDSLKTINELNSLFPDTVFGVNHFADLTQEEKQNYLGMKPFNTTKTEAVDPILPDEFMDPPAALDWRDKGVVSSVKYQARCGSCYIFTAIGNIEGQYAMKHQQCIQFSEQQCLECLPGTTCEGGWPHDVMNKLAQDESACMTEQDYPYTAPSIGQCREDKSKRVATVLSGQQLNIPDEDVLLQTLAQYGPLSVVLDSADLFEYTGGILPPNRCREKTDHAVLLVGYGEENGTKFWIIKNSWGTNWGENGYLRLLRGVNACHMGTSYTATSEVA